MPKYSKATQNMVEEDMHRFKKGTLKSGPGGKGGTVKNPKQAIAIALSEAREKGMKAPKNPEEKTKTTSKRATAKRAAPRRATAKKAAPKKAAAKRAAPKKAVRRMAK
ncbi:DUF6496 domain-containing protein [Pinibacter aurantiacus]|uniref:Histone H1 n=1 Tax=Pinibacter aurantiacus TaxID=2851599 RepID=A0A9E2SC92_9BACT|nr:DUF6496 domain-containing protein [Pinibacter aurantiacus]MBV4360336.1 hypothetical protein [Pinibacter aurantiacus]